MPRWEFIQWASRAEEREAALHRIDSWWKAFAAHAEQLDAHFARGMELDVPSFMQQHLTRVDPRLMWEFGPSLSGEGHRLVITCECDRELRPLVETLIEKAPSLTRWEFQAYRPPVSLDWAQKALDARAGGRIEDLRVEATLEHTGLIDLQFTGYGSLASRRRAGDAAFVATESLLGERVLDHWIGGIAAEAAPGLVARLMRRHNGFPLSELREIVDELRTRHLNTLPDAPWHEWTRASHWNLLELTPSKADDYYGRSDLFVAKTPHAKLFQATLEHTFHSGRFSKHDELFCYLKLDGSQGLDHELFADKAAIEGAMDELLIPEGLGCQIGGGTGLRYSYVDLVLTDPDRALPLVVERLREGHVPLRSWILFFDADLQGVWMGIHPDTPAPPTPDKQ